MKPTPPVQQRAADGDGGNGVPAPCPRTMRVPGQLVERRHHASQRREEPRQGVDAHSCQSGNGPKIEGMLDSQRLRIDDERQTRAGKTSRPASTRKRRQDKPLDQRALDRAEHQPMPSGRYEGQQRRPAVRDQDARERDHRTHRKIDPPEMMTNVARTAATPRKGGCPRNRSLTTRNVFKPRVGDAPGGVQQH